ncbi:TonB-dependent siderophore receptor [Rhodovibrionaceae bacterium A322]
MTGSDVVEVAGRQGDAGRKRTLSRAVLMKSTALMGCLLALAVAAPVAEAGSAEVGLQLVQASKRWNFSIAAQDLSSALLAFSNETGIQVVFKSQDLEGIKTEGLFGDKSADDALATLLGSANLHYVFSSDNSVVVSAGPRDEASVDGAHTLEQLTIEGLRGITSYLPTEGYVSYYSVAATKTDTPVLETPQSISTIGREELTAHNSKTVAEALRYSPGVTVDAYGVDPRGYDWISIRGFDAATTGSFRDGLRMDGNAFAIYNTETYGLERVDVMRGPSGALYGQGEAGGVINGTSKRPRADQPQEVQLEVGSWNRFQGAFDVGGAATEDHSLLFRVVGLGRVGNTEYDYNDGTKQDDDRFFIAPSLTWNPTDRTSLTFLTEYQKDKNSTQFTTFGTPEIGKTDVVPGEPGFDKFEQEQYSLGYALTHDFGDDWTFRQNTRYMNVDVKYQAVVPNYLDADGVTLHRYSWASPDQLSQFAIDNQLEKRLNWGPTSHTILGGVDYSRSTDEYTYHYGPANPIDLTNVVYSGGTIVDPYADVKQTLSQAGVYLQDQIVLYDDWIATLGGRYSWVEQKTSDAITQASETKKDSAFTGRAGLTYLFDNGLAPYASYTEGFVPIEGTNLSGESFKPEESTQYEAGLKYQPPSTNALFTASLFHLTKTNVLTRDPDNLFASIQSGEIRSRGLELEGKASLFSGWDITGAYAFTDAEVTKSNDDDLGKTPVVVPRHTASAWVHYNFLDGALEGLGLGGGVRYIGSSWNDTANTSKNPSYTLFDATLSYAFTEELALKVDAKNLFNKEYTTTCAFSTCYYGSGRRFFASMAYRW